MFDTRFDTVFTTMLGSPLAQSPDSIGPMANTIKKITKGQVGIIVLAIAGVVGLRLLASRKINGAERLADGLLDTDKLNEALRNLPDATEVALASCAAYVVNVAYRAAEGQGITGVMEDPLGFSRTQRHPYTQAVTRVLTEAHSPAHRLTYAVTVPDIADVRGTREVGPVRISGLSPARPAPDTVQITLPQDYTAQAETEFEIADYLVTGQTRLFGSATLRDNRGNVGRIHIGFDGTVTGTITREAHIVGRFEGKVATGITFRRYELPPNDAASTETAEPKSEPPSETSSESTDNNGPTLQNPTEPTQAEPKPTETKPETNF